MYHRLQKNQIESDDYTLPIYFLFGLYTIYVIVWSLVKTNDLSIFSLSFLNLNMTITTLIFNRKILNSYTAAICIPSWVVASFDIFFSFFFPPYLANLVFHATIAVLSTFTLFRKNTNNSFAFLSAIFISFYFLMMRNNGILIHVNYITLFMVDNAWLQVLIIFTSSVVSILLNLLIKSTTNIKKKEINKFW